MRKIQLTLLVLFALSANIFAQPLSFPINTHSGQIIETCSGIFTHSGIDTIAPYSANENYNVTFTNDGIQAGVNFIKLDFLFFDLRDGDFLYVYDGADSSAPLIVQATGRQLRGTQIYSTGTSLHIRFTSTGSDQGLGWMAMVQCFSQCEALELEISTDAGKFDFCPGVQSIPFSASASYLGGDAVTTGFVYEWDFKNGQILSGSDVAHSFSGSGVFPFTVNVTDNVNGCRKSIANNVRISTIPSFGGTVSSVDTVCAREDFTLTGRVTPTTWTGFRTTVDTIAKVTQGNPFESTLNFNIFKPEDQIATIQDIDKVCIDIEHLDFGQLQFVLECPGGASVILHDTGAGGANLGEPVAADPNIYGVGYEYCFTPTPQFATLSETSFRFHSYLDRAGIGYYFNVPYLPPGNYTTVQTFENFTGCPLNGNWTIRVRDEVADLSGHVFGWSLFFNDRFIPDSLIFTPEIERIQWFDGATALTGNPVNVSKDRKGNYEFVLRAIDDLGCRWDTTIVVTVLPLPEAGITSGLEIPVCEGDSTILTLSPTIGSATNWIYQWSINNAELQGRTNDTLMAKLPGNYMVWVKDTLTRCFDSFELLVSDKNCDLTIPNVFTPNGDGINDVFEILNLEHYPRSQIVIYNRQGRKVFEHSDYFGNWWDGENHPDGTYYYVLTYTRQGHRRHSHGVIAIVR